MNKNNIKEYIRALNHIKGFFENLLETPDNEMDSNKDWKLIDFTNMRLLLKSDAWPEAVPRDSICGESDEEKLFRAYGILNDFEINNIDGKFLDFGCGEGHLAFTQAKEFSAEKSVGYDIKEQNWKRYNEENGVFSKFEKKDNLIFTTNWSVVEDNGPYDIILCNDVLDHTESPIKELEKIQKVKKPNGGKVIVRVHPWTSRHGSHLYKQLNKAYIHLVFTEEELFKLGIEPQKINKISDPLSFYKKAFIETGFNILKEDVVSQPAEQFFAQKDILRKIRNNWPSDVFKEDMIKNMEIQFIDFTLT